MSNQASNSISRLNRSQPVSDCAPELLEEFIGFASERDKDRNLAELPGTSWLRARWQCRLCGHKYSRPIKERTLGQGCKKCGPSSERKNLATKRPDIAAEWHPTKNKRSADEITNLRDSTAVWWLCERGHTWEKSVAARLKRDVPCPICKKSADKQAMQLEALNYESRWEFQQKSRNTYMTAQRRGWLEEICTHMNSPQRDGGWSDNRNKWGHWTKERCRREARNYEYRFDFQKNSTQAYLAARKKGWLDDICAHMKVRDHGLLCGYVILNDRLKKAYVGITARPFEVRKQQHQLDNSTTSRFIVNENDTQFEQLTDHTTPPDRAAVLERELYDRFSSLGYDMLNNESNIGATGGSEVKWTPQALRDEAKNYRTKSEFRRNSPKAYSSAQYQGLLDELQQNMQGRMPNGYWSDKARCVEEARKYNSRSEFRRKSSGAYGAASKFGWLGEICSHMDRLVSPRGTWQKFENCKNAAAQFERIPDFRKFSSAAYNSAKSNGWLEDICRHMQPQKKRHPRGYWTKRRCHGEALKYASRKAFHKGAPGAYDKAKDNGWIDEICSHMARSSRGGSQ